MLQKRLPGVPSTTAAAPAFADARAGANLAESAERLLAAVRRQWVAIALCLVLAVAGGVAYLLTAVPLYTATVTILTNQNTTKLIHELSIAEGDAADDGGMQSQVELIRSEKVGLRVVDSLGLATDMRFLKGVPGMVDRVTDFGRGLFRFESWFATVEAPPEPTDETRRWALSVLRNGLEAQRVGRTYALDVSFTSPDPATAARVAAAYGEAYIADQIDTMYEATRTAGDWLQRRIEELRRLAVESDLAVQKFRSEHGLIAIAEVLVTEQNLSEINRRLIEAQEETAQAQARFERIKDIIDSGSTDALVSDALDSSVVYRIRERYLDAAKRESEIRAQLGADHEQAVRLRGEMDEYRRQMFEELGRIAESYQSDVEVARSRENSIRASAAGATEETIASGEVMVELRELERQAETYRDLYERFLERYQEAVQQESFPIIEARIINPAKAPTRPSSPNAGLVLALSGLLGLAAGAGLAAFREHRDRYFRTGDQIRAELGVPFIGVAPKLEAGRSAQPSASRPAHPRQVNKRDPIGDYVIDHPQSQLAETLRSTQFQVDVALGERRPKVIGVVSVLPGEGKTTTSLNLAELLASQGGRTLLIDADLRRPGLTRSVARHAETGLIEGILDRRPLRDLLIVNPRTKLAMIPAVVRQRVTHSSELLASEGMEDLIAAAGEAFEYVVLDLPPLLPVVDARAVAPRVDAFVLVVAWGETTRHVVRSTLEREPLIAEKLVGAILNKVDQDRMKYYWSFGSTEYYYSRYSSYHETGPAAGR